MTVDVDLLMTCIVNVNAPTQLFGTVGDDEGVSVMISDFKVHVG